MKKLFKFLIFFVIIVVLLIGIPLLYLYITIFDSTDEAPTALYNESVTVEGETAKFVQKALSNETDYYFTLSEDELNLLIFAYIRKNINTEYYNENCDLDSCKYIMTFSIPDGVPILGGKRLILKHAYAKMTGDDLTFYITTEVIGMKTHLNFAFEIEETDESYSFIITKAGLGGLNFMKGIGKLFKKPLFAALNFTESKLNSFFDEKGLPIKFNEENFSFSLKKIDTGTFISWLLFPDAEGLGNKVVGELFQALAVPENEILSLGFLKKDGINTFGARINMSPFIADETVYSSKLAAITVPFDSDNFIKNKTQTFLLDNILGGEMKLTFTENEFNRLLYDKTGGYVDFKYEIQFSDDVKYGISLEGMYLRIVSDEEMEFSFLVDINGLKSVMGVTGHMTSNIGENEIRIILSEEAAVGTVVIPSDFLFEIIENNIDALLMMTFDPEDGAFIVSAQTFTEMMTIGGDATPLCVHKIKFAAGILKVYVTVSDPELQGIINDVTGLLEDLLAGNFLDGDAFSGQGDLIADLGETLDNISDILNSPDGELATEQIDDLIDIINELNEQNQQEFYNQIEDALATDEELQDLYNLLFGN